MAGQAGRTPRPPVTMPHAVAIFWGAMTDLIITNGDSAADLLRLAGREGVILPWRDVLHEGPIVAGDLTTCSAARIAYLTRRFWLAEADIVATFAERDGLIRNHRDFARVELWFEHDLYDQLQLMQILAFFAAEGAREGLVLVQAHEFLGAQTPATILRFAEGARMVGPADLTRAAAVWADLTAPTPEPVAARARDLDPAFPFLQPALRRFLEELPAPETGLGRTERAILAGIADGTSAPVDLFREMLAEEPAAFMGDWSFFHLIDDLAFCSVPLVTGLARRSADPDEDGARFRDAALELTLAGEDVLAGEEDHVTLNGLDRWWGGTHLDGHSVWRYVPETGGLVPPEPSGA